MCFPKKGGRGRDGSSLLSYETTAKAPLFVTWLSVLGMVPAGPQNSEAVKCSLLLRNVPEIVPGIDCVKVMGVEAVPAAIVTGSVDGIGVPALMHAPLPQMMSKLTVGSIRDWPLIST